MNPETKERATNIIEYLILGRYFKYRIMSLKEMKTEYPEGGYTHELIQDCDGITIWGVFFEFYKVVCLYTQDHRARILYYDPESETLKKFEES